MTSTTGPKRARKLSSVEAASVQGKTPHLSMDLASVINSFLEGVDSARSLTVAILLRYGEWDQVINLTCNPSEYLTADDFRAAALSSDLLRKFIPRGYDTTQLEDATFKKWLWAEHQCYRSNLRLDPYLYGPSLGPLDEHVVRLVERARKKIEIWIGRGPKQPQGAFGPGATVSDSSRRTTVLDKMSSVPTLTPGAWRLLPLWSSSKWRAAFGDGCLSEVRGNTYFSVPKNCSIRRPCGKEPSLNVFYQLGFGRELRRHLALVGFDLDTGQHVHQEVACAASIRNDRATIDLSSASDCVSSNLVKLLLPALWKKYLDSVRSPTTLVGEKTYVLSKYSSMGNGFTFELETLLFGALIAATLESTGKPAKPGRDFYVYGDDLIVNSESSKDVLAVLKFFGFTPNPRKSFTEGNFRESCGGDFFNGESVRAHFIEEEPDEPHKWIALANGLRRAASQAEDGRLAFRTRRAWFRCLDNIPTPIRACRGPEMLGDLVIHDDPSKWQYRWRSSIRYIRVWRPAEYRKVSWQIFDPDVQFAAALYGVRLERPDRLLVNCDDDPQGYKRGFIRTLSDVGSFIIPRDGVKGYKVGWVPFS